MTFEHAGTRIPHGPDKDPDATVRYGVDWSTWLDTGETITGSSWITTLTTSGANNDTTSTSVLLSGGTVSTRYLVTNRITTSTGQTEDRSFYVYVREK